jgi:hypothetical protein
MKNFKKWILPSLVIIVVIFWISNTLLSSLNNSRGELSSLQSFSKISSLDYKLTEDWTFRNAADNNTLIYDNNPKSYLLVIQATPVSELTGTTTPSSIYNLLNIEELKAKNASDSTIKNDHFLKGNIAGENAVIETDLKTSTSTQRSNDYYLSHRAFIHAGIFYSILFRSNSGDVASSEADFQSMVKTFSFKQ